MTKVFEQSNPNGVSLFRATEAGNLSTGITQQTIDVNASFSDNLGSGTQQISINAITWNIQGGGYLICLLYTSPSPRDGLLSRMPSSA